MLLISADLTTSATGFITNVCLGTSKDSLFLKISTMQEEERDQILSDILDEIRWGLDWLMRMNPRIKFV